ncbi:MAG: NUDIX hydrolase [Kangiellaceae bacterium]|jgi:ADP-ribose pyrophosphatase YjhB (NUDIX family)|nr:NUDIX hydrolase [Kangiellaceae bacterium]
MHTINVTVAAIIQSKNKFLMVEEHETDGSVVFNQPAGHVEANESIEQAVVREVFEETGLEFLPEYLIGTYLLSPADNGKHYLRFCYYGNVQDESQVAPRDSDIIAAHWMTIEQIMALGTKLRSGLVLKCLNDFKTGAKHPLNSIEFCPDESELIEICYNRLQDLN